MGDGTVVRVDRNRLSETIADETIIINLEDGCYYRVRGQASALWERLSEPIEAEAVLSVAFTEPAPSAGDVARYVLDLERAALVVVGQTARARLAACASQAGGETASGLILETYDDMADLLLLDPVHDVGEEGWPARGVADASASAGPIEPVL